MISNNKTRNIIACGRPGVGKSALGNSLLYGSPQCYYGFESYSDPTKWGVTREIVKRTEYVQEFNASLQFIDIPGQGDHTLDMKQMAESLSYELEDVTMNAILFLVAVQDERFTTQELCSIQFIKSFFKERGYNCQDILWLVITHCEQKKPSNQFIQSKLANLKKWGLFIPQQNVVEYDKNLSKFKPFIERVLKVPANQGFTLNKDKQNSLNQFYQGCNLARDVNLQRLKDKEEERENKIQQERLQKLKEQYEIEIIKQEQLYEQLEQNQITIEYLRSKRDIRNPDCILI
ncbi:hypothetical protein ABPG72_011268 [Tetrahymena utriculariae]